MISIATCPASKLNVTLSCSAKHVMSTFMKGLEMNDTHGSSCSRSHNLFSNSCPSLYMTSQYFSATLSNVSDAEALPFSTDYTEGKCGTFILCKSTEKMFNLALKAFKALIISTTDLPLPRRSQFKWFSFPVMSVKNARSSVHSVSSGSELSSPLDCTFGTQCLLIDDAVVMQKFVELGNLQKVWVTLAVENETCVSTAHRRSPVCSHHYQLFQWYFFLHEKLLHHVTNVNSPPCCL